MSQLICDSRGVFRFPLAPFHVPIFDARTVRFKSGWSMAKRFDGDELRRMIEDMQRSFKDHENAPGAQGVGGRGGAVVKAFLEFVASEMERGTSASDLLGGGVGVIAGLYGALMINVARNAGLDPLQPALRFIEPFTNGVMATIASGERSETFCRLHDVQ